jgi:hypothetical protein
MKTSQERVFAIKFARVYPLYVQKAERKNRTTFNPHASLIKGVVCGVRVEDIENPLMQKVRYLDKLIDELTRGKAMDEILRQ